MMHDEVVFTEVSGIGGDVGVITLNKPQVLNSLNHGMIKAISMQLQIWGQARYIKAVVIKAAPGRAFCAGGDLRYTYERWVKNDPSLTDFFYDEYQLNRFIFHFPKPYIALLDGITMGGGVGISMHGSHRIATERLVFAMPETGIGFFPDVGGTYFLPRLPGKIGFYLGLIGTQLTSDDCVALGMTQQKVASASLPQLIQTSAKEPFTDDPHSVVNKVIEQFSIPVQPPSLLQHQFAIDTCFSKGTVEEIIVALGSSTNALCKEAA